MKKEQKNTIILDMEDVIATSKQVRNLLLDDNISDLIKREKMPSFRLVLEANKNIVASSNVKINVDRLTNGK